MHLYKAEFNSQCDVFLWEHRDDLMGWSLQEKQHWLLSNSWRFNQSCCAVVMLNMYSLENILMILWWHFLLWLKAEWSNKETITHFGLGIASICQIDLSWSPSWWKHLWSFADSLIGTVWSLKYYGVYTEALLWDFCATCSQLNSFKSGFIVI